MDLPSADPVARGVLVVSLQPSVARRGPVNRCPALPSRLAWCGGSQEEPAITSARVKSASRGEFSTETNLVHSGADEVRGWKVPEKPSHEWRVGGGGVGNRTRRQSTKKSKKSKTYRSKAGRGRGACRNEGPGERDDE